MADRIRLDKWLWHARFFKTRSLATRLVSGGHVRVNSVKVSKPATVIQPGDVLSFAQARRVRIVRVSSISTRRGPASEAAELYDDLTPAPEEDVPQPPKSAGKGRPTKKDRRRLDLTRTRTLE